MTLFGKLGIRFGLHCERIGPYAPRPQWAYTEVSGLLTAKVNPEQVHKLWPKIFATGTTTRLE